MDRTQAKTIILHAVKTTEPRWREYAEHWKDINEIFIRRGYEQQGFLCSKLTDALEVRGIFSIPKLGSILSRYEVSAKYDREFAGALTAEFYEGLRKGSGGEEGQLFEEAVREFFNKKLGSPGRTFWRLNFYMLQACAYLKEYYSGDFSSFVISKYKAFANKPDITAEDFLKTPVSDWERFLTATKPWTGLKGIGPNVWDFIFGDIVEAYFAEHSYKFDSANQRFLNVTGISRLIAPFEREAATRFIKKLEIPYTLREINKGIYTYCSKTEKEKYGFCWERVKCESCAVNPICEKNI